jgi:hypothetical protein
MASASARPDHRMLCGRPTCMQVRPCRSPHHTYATLAGVSCPPACAACKGVCVSPPCMTWQCSDTSADPQIASQSMRLPPMWATCVRSQRTTVTWTMPGCVQLLLSSAPHALQALHIAAMVDDNSRRQQQPTLCCCRRQQCQMAARHVGLPRLPWVARRHGGGPRGEAQGGCHLGAAGAGEGLQGRQAVRRSGAGGTTPVLYARCQVLTLHCCCDAATTSTTSATACQLRSNCAQTGAALQGPRNCSWNSCHTCKIV